MIYFTYATLQIFIWILFSLTNIKILCFILITIFSKKKRKEHLNIHTQTNIDIIIAAYNEEKVIIQTINNLLEIDYPYFNIIVVNDGSTDNTLEVLKLHYNLHANVKIVSQSKMGKSHAANYGLTFSTSEIVAFIDADTQVPSNILQIISNCFFDKEVCAMAGYLKVQNLENMLTIGQNIEYATVMNLEREMFSKINTLTTIPGAICAFRKLKLLEIGGFRNETITEDCDITFKILKTNYRIVNERKAIAYTLAPTTLRMFIRQRIRWYYGIIQNILKHANIKNEINNRILLVVIYYWIYRIGYTLLFPIADYLFFILLINKQITYNYLFFLLFETLVFTVILIKEVEKINWKTILFIFYRVIFRHLKFFALLLSIYKFITKDKLRWKKITRNVQA